MKSLLRRYVMSHRLFQMFIILHYSMLMKGSVVISAKDCLVHFLPVNINVMMFLKDYQQSQKGSYPQMLTQTSNYVIIISMSDHVRSLAADINAMMPEKSKNISKWDTLDP